MIKNNYLDIAKNDLEYLESILAVGSTFYNQLAVQCQQVTEKFLKGYLELCFLDEDVSDLLRKHNMKKIAVRFGGMDFLVNIEILLYHFRISMLKFLRNAQV